MHTIRKIAALLAVCGMVGVASSTLLGLALYCGTGTQSCMTAAVTFSVVDTPLGDIATDQSFSAPLSSDTMSTRETPLAFFGQALQLTSVYAIMIGVVLLLVLEFRELHYLRILTQTRRLG